MQEKILNFQEIINQKDIALNNTHKILANIYDRYNQLEKEYQTKIEKLKQEIEEKEEDYKYMGDKLIDTFSYLNKYIAIPEINVEPFEQKEKKEYKEYKERSHKNLYNVKTYQEERNRQNETNMKKQTTLSSTRRKKKNDKNNIE